MLIGINGYKFSGKDLVGKIINYCIAQKEMLDTYPNWGRDYNLTPFTENAYLDYLNFEDNNAKFKIRKFAEKLKKIVSILLNCTLEDLEDQEFKEKELGPEWDKYYTTFNGVKYFYSTYDECLKVSDTLNPPILIKLTPRLLLQLIGTNCFRDIIHPDIWVNSLMNEYIETIDMSSAPYRAAGINIKSLGFPDWIITDMRFSNEFKAIKERNGISIRINRKYTSKKWQELYPNIVVLDPDGWNRDERYNFEWFQEKISFSEYKKKVFLSSCLQKNNVKLFDYFNQHESETALDDATFDYVIENDSNIDSLILKVKDILIKEKIL